MNTRLPLALMFGSIILSAAPAFADGNCAKEWSWGGCAITSRSSELNLKAETYADASESFVDSSDPRGVTADGPLSFTAADPAPMPSPLPNPVLDHHQIYLHNSCSRRLQAAIAFRDLNSQLQVRGWILLEPGQDGYAGDTREGDFFTYAEGIDPRPELRLIWSGMDASYKIHGSTESYGFTKIQIKADHFVKWTQNFVCAGITPLNTVALATNAEGGWSWQKYLTMQQAEARALEICNNKAGGNCKILKSIENSAYTCLGVARDRDHKFFTESATDLDAAKAAALRQCASSAGMECQMITGFCND